MQTRTSVPLEQSQSRQTPHSTQLKEESAMQMPDTRTVHAAQRRTQDLANSSHSSSQLKMIQAKMQSKAEVAQRVEEEEPMQAKFLPVQRAEEEEPLQGKFETAQRAEEEEPLQGKFETAQRAEEEEPLQGKFGTAQREEKAKPNNTGLPNQLKAGIESMSGMSMDHVKVHYNSDKPAQLNAHAYAQGSDIHVAPGQERHIPHEAWHVVQQAQGRVKPTMQMKAGTPVNDDVALETEADVMGAKAVAANMPVQLMAAEAEFSNKHLAISEDDAKTKTENRTGKLGKAKKNSVMNYADPATKSAFDGDTTQSGPVEVAAVGWEVLADKRGPGRKAVSVGKKAGKFKVTVSKGVANHSDGWDS